MTKIKLSKQELTEMVQRSISKVLKENWSDDMLDTQQHDIEQSDINNNGPRNISDESEEFIPHGSYTVSNSGGYEIMLSNDGDMAKVKDAFGSDNPEISDWLPIEYVESEDETDEEGYPEMIPVIDPEGYNIPLNQVMRTNRFNESKNKKLNKKMISELDYGGQSASPGVKPIGYNINTKFLFTDPVGTSNPNKQYQILQFLDNGQVKVKDLYRDDVEIFSTKSLNDLLANGEIKIVNESKNPKKIKLKLSELREIIKNVIKEENTK